MCIIKTFIYCYHLLFLIYLFTIKYFYWFCLSDDIVELSTDNYLKVISVLASRSPRARTPLPSGLRTEHSVIELPPVHQDEAAIDVSLSLVTSGVPTCNLCTENCDTWVCDFSFLSCYFSAHLNHLSSSHFTVFLYIPIPIHFSHPSLTIRMLLT